MSAAPKSEIHWEWIVLAGAGSLMVTMGARNSLGLYVAPIDASTGMGVGAISLALAIAQFVWGAAQPIAGAVADRYGAGRVVVAGLLLLALGNALTPLVSNTAGLSLTIGVLAASGAGFASYSVVMGAAAKRVPPSKRGIASGVIGAGGSMGQFIFAPIMGVLIQHIGWMNAMRTSAVLVLFALPLARVVRRPDTYAPAHTHSFIGGIVTAARGAFSDKNYLLLHASFFTCGFHIAFLVTHLPGEIELCGLSPTVASWSISIIGLFNIMGSLFTGWCISRYLSKNVLAWMYASRAVLILMYLAAPKTVLTFYVFAAGLGLTWLATVPATAMVVNKLFGTRNLSTLVGLTLLSHQVGAFFGAWLGGVAFEMTGNFNWMWYADIALAAVAALLNLPIREPRVAKEVHA